MNIISEKGKTNIQLFSAYAVSGCDCGCTACLRLSHRNGGEDA